MAAMTKYSFREMKLAETRRMIGYFLTAERDFLHGMGVDPPKMPSEEDWFELLKTYETKPGWIAFRQPVNLWGLDRPAWLDSGS